MKAHLVLHLSILGFGHWLKEYLVYYPFSTTQTLCVLYWLLNRHMYQRLLLNNFFNRVHNILLALSKSEISSHMWPFSLCKFTTSWKLLTLSSLFYREVHTSAKWTTGKEETRISETDRAKRDGDLGSRGGPGLMGNQTVRGKVSKFGLDVSLTFNNMIKNQLVILVKKTKQYKLDA